jgi:general secretion pathway protein J
MEMKNNPFPPSGPGPVASAVPGFTLIEMLLAIAIFSMVIGVIFTSFRLGISSWEKGEKDLERYQRMRAISELFYREIRSCFPYILTPGELDKHVQFYAFFGEPDSLKFVSSASIAKTNRGLSLLEFWVNPKNGLMVGEDRALGQDLSDSMLRDENRSTVIDSSIKKVRFRYYDQKKKGEQGEWVQRWNPRDKTGSEMRLPRAVQLSIEYDMGRGRVFTEELMIPIYTDIMSAFYGFGV